MKNNYKAFTFVELLLVMLVLGIIITLTMPILKNLKDDDDIYRSYLKKATQDVSDAANMIFIKEPKFTGFDVLSNDNDSALLINGKNYLTANCNGLRYAFNMALGTYYCGYGQEAGDNKQDSKNMEDNNKYLGDDCLNGKTYTDIDGANLRNGNYSSPGLVLAGKPVFVFQYYKGGNEQIGGEDVYGYIYADMNKDKSPNEPCKDRYRFIVFRDRVTLDTRENYTCVNGVKQYEANSGCSFNLSRSCTANVNDLSGR